MKSVRRSFAEKNMKLRSEWLVGDGVTLLKEVNIIERL